MRRFIGVMCVLFLFLPTSGTVQHVSARTPNTLQSTEAVFATNPAIFTTPGKVNSLVPLSDGRVLVGGSFVAIGGQASPRSLAVINSDGSLDMNFQADPNLQIYEVYDAALQPDGKIVIAGWFTKLPSPFTYFLLRLNPDGSVDTTFNTVGINGQVFAILVDGDKILIGGNFTSPAAHIARLNQNGTPDSAFNGAGSGPDGIVRGVARQSSGKYIIVGEFSNINSLSQVGVARLNANGSLDSSFVPGGFRASTQVAVLNDDSVLVGGDSICGDDLFAWYTASGNLKQALAPTPNAFQSITTFLPLSDGGFLIGGWYSAVCINGSPTEHAGEVWRYASDGTYHTMVTFGSEADMLAMALRSDGKLILGGQGRPETSTEVGWFDGLALLDLADNGLEKVAAFHPIVGDEAEISSLSRYSDGKLLVAGNFSYVNGNPRFGLARLLADGSLDASFQPFEDQPGGWSNAALALSDGRAVAGFGHSGLYLIGLDGSLTDLSAFNDYDRVSVLALQSDGKVLVGSDFGLGVRRLRADFSGIDATFTPGDAYGGVYALSVQVDGKILVAGDFDKYNNVDVPGLVRLNSSGSVEDSFKPPLFMLDEYNTATLYSLTPLSNGKLLVGGDFTTVGGEEHPALVRLNNDGAQDTGFSAPTDFYTIKSTCVQADNSIWVGGVDATYFRNPLILHIDENGAQDSAFQSDYQSAHDDGAVNVVLCDTNGLSWTGGMFSLIDGRPFNSLARYLPLGGRLFLPLLTR
jgi:uncharacterized delta-60 repeat protein